MEQLALPKTDHTLEEYFEIEEASEQRFEFRDGQVVNMSGTSYAHSVIAMNVGAELRAALKGTPCRVSDSGLRVQMRRRTQYGHPDVTVICGEPVFDPEDPNGQTICNPTLLVEVLSPSTESYDRSKKFGKYRNLDSFKEYVLVSQTEPRVETFYKTPEGIWSIGATVDGLTGTVPLRSLQVHLSMTEIFAGVTFPAPTDPAVPE